MSNLEEALKSVVLGGVGSVANVLDKGAEIGKTLVEKGEETVKENQETLDTIRQKIKETIEAGKNIDIKLDFDFTVLTREQRDALRQKLDEADAKEDAEAAEAAEAEANEAADAEEAAEEAETAGESDEETGA